MGVINHIFDRHIVFGAALGIFASISIAQYNGILGAVTITLTALYMLLRVATQFVKLRKEAAESILAQDQQTLASKKRKDQQ